MVRRLAAIDPGTRTTGLAMFDNGRLVEAGAQRILPEESLVAFARRIIRAARRDVRNFPSCPSVDPQTTSFVIESPHDQRGRARVDDILLLARFVGMLQAFCLPSEVVLVRPSDWKGTIPKPKRAADPYVIAYRGARELSPTEHKAIFLPRAKKQQWDVWDAIVIGLWHLRRRGGWV